MSNKESKLEKEGKLPLFYTIGLGKLLLRGQLLELLQPIKPVTNQCPPVVHGFRANGQNVCSVSGQHTSRRLPT